jgi:hypothetical protein
MKFARYVFAAAGVWGVLVVTPLFWMADLIGRQYPPAIGHPDFYVGFIVVTLAWQMAFLIIAIDPVRFRPLILAAMVEKFGYVAALVTLFRQGRIAVGQFAVCGPDLVLGVLFMVAFVRSRPSRVAARAGSLTGTRPAASGS